MMQETIKSEEGTWVHEGTDMKVVSVLEYLRQDRNEKGQKTRVKISFGNTETGSIDWVEFGRISRSTGEKPIFLLVHNQRSMGGGAISTRCILKIETSSNKNYDLFYKHPKCP
jgi:hypothetical protein